jgi:hypothetical protein
VIINIRGTSGSGKSTLVRRVLANYKGRVSFREEGRKQPIGYLYQHPTGGRSLAVVGHYETPCGGCDTISKMERIFELVRQSHAAGHDVLYEGLLISADVVRTAALHHEGLPLHVVALDVPIEVCLDSVNGRRREKNPDKPPVNPKNTESKHRGVQQSVVRLREHGVDVSVLDRDGAYARLQELLGL